MSETQALYQRLRAFDVDGGPSEYPFAARLARENGWSESYARRVVDEYFKFVALAMTAGHPVTPSDQVDEAWHLHMIYTRSYWERFTPLLPRPLHHSPTRGGAAEEAKFEDFYVRTLASYRAAFGPEPSDIWPSSETRFAPGPAWKKVYLRDYWLVPRRNLRVAGLLVAPLVLAGCLARVEVTGFRLEVNWLLLGGLGIVGFAVLMMIISAIRKSQGGGHNASGCSSGTYYGGTTGGSSSDGRSSDNDSGSSSSGDSGGSDGGAGGGDGGGGGCGGGCGGGGD